MSLTGTHHVFASISENGVNIFLKAFFTARPRFRRFGSPHFVPATTPAATEIPAITFPGIGGGIQYEVIFGIPVTDLFPPDPVSPTPPLVPSPDGLTVHDRLELIVGCSTGTDKPGDDGRPGPVTPLKTLLDVWAKGHPTSTFFSPGVGDVSFVLDAVRIPTVKPVTLEAVLDCIARMILEAILQNASLPFKVITVDTIQLILEAGPQISSNQIQIWGDI
ncbi:MAG: hypothetical protein WA175_12650 [Candidatus Acidiferrales bacterium]